MHDATWFTCETVFGPMTVECCGGAVVGIRLDGTPGKGKQQRTELSDKTQAQLNEYFSGKRRSFELPLSPKGTAFQQKVWHALLEIPYGETRCYQQIAEAAGNPLACRAVGMANNRNPLPILIPCHRVVGKSGSLVGYRGGLEMKAKLLALEKAQERLTERENNI